MKKTEIERNESSGPKGSGEKTSCARKRRPKTMEGNSNSAAFTALWRGLSGDAQSAEIAVKLLSDKQLNTMRRATFAPALRALVGLRAAAVEAALSGALASYGKKPSFSSSVRSPSQQVSRSYTMGESVSSTCTEERPEEAELLAASSSDSELLDAKVVSNLNARWKQRWAFVDAIKGQAENKSDGSFDCEMEDLKSKPSLGVLEEQPAPITPPPASIVVSLGSGFDMRCSSPDDREIINSTNRNKRIQWIRVDRRCVQELQTPFCQAVGCGCIFISGDVCAKETSRKITKSLRAWSKLMLASLSNDSGSASSVKLVWLAEGLFEYLTLPQQERLLRSISASSRTIEAKLAPRIKMETRIVLPLLSPHLEGVKGMRFGWKFSKNVPWSVLKEEGWSTVAVKGCSSTNTNHCKKKQQQHSWGTLLEAFRVNNVRMMTTAKEGAATLSHTAAAPSFDHKREGEAKSKADASIDSETWIAKPSETRFTASGVEICLAHNYALNGCAESRMGRPCLKGRQGRCPLDHDHCHRCGKKGHSAKRCIMARATTTADVMTVVAAAAAAAAAGSKEVRGRTQNEIQHSSHDEDREEEYDKKQRGGGDIKLDQQGRASSSSSSYYIYAVGGRVRGRTIGTVERFSVSKGIWETCARIAEPRGSLAMAAVGTQVFAIGGSGIASNLDSCECLETSLSDDLKTPWQKCPTIGTARHALAATESGGKIWVVGGWKYGDQSSGETECLDLRKHFETNASNTNSEGGAGRYFWRPCSSLNVARKLHGLTSLGGKLYVFGGMAANSFKPLSSAECYDPQSDKWGPIRDMPSGARCCATRVGGAIYIILFGEAPEFGVLRYDVKADRYEKLARLPIEKWFGFSCAVVGDRYVHVLGGKSNGKWIGCHYCYDTQEDSWQELPGMLAHRRRLGVVAVATVVTSVSPPPPPPPPPVSRDVVAAVQNKGGGTGKK